MSERKIAFKKEDLPQLKEGYARAVHLTKAPQDYINKIIKEGLDYSAHGMLQSTARYWSNENDVEYYTQDPRFSGEGTKAVVLDIPFEQIRLHDDVTKAPGVVPKEYIVGILDVSKKPNELEKKVSTAIGILGLGSALFFLSSNLTGNVIGGLNQNYSNIIGGTLFLVSLVGAFFYFKKKK